MDADYEAWAERQTRKREAARTLTEPLPPMKRDPYADVEVKEHRLSETGWQRILKLFGRLP